VQRRAAWVGAGPCSSAVTGGTTPARVRHVATAIWRILRIKGILSRECSLQAPSGPAMKSGPGLLIDTYTTIVVPGMPAGGVVDVADEPVTLSVPTSG
jgi:hypothetical protein